MEIVTRFAPSPTGYLHLGHAFAALTAWRRAREAGGRFLLRLEDIDPGRCRAEFAAAIEEDLAWLGLDWDGAVRVQSAHLPDYRAVLDGLAGRGLVYPCFCTRADIAREVAASAAAPHGPDGAPLYPGTCRRLPAAVASAGAPGLQCHPRLRGHLLRRAGPQDGVGSPAGGRAGLLKGDDLGMRPAEPRVKTFAHDAVAHDDDRADHRVGTGKTFALLRQAQRNAHVSFISIHWRSSPTLPSASQHAHTAL